VLANSRVLSVDADIPTLKNNQKSPQQAHEAALRALRADELTGLPNRRHILGLLDETLVANEDRGTGLCIAMHLRADIRCHDGKVDV
jgi:PleD family two-component response regulator